QGFEVVFLRGLTLAFFIDNAMIGLNSLNQLLIDKQVDQSFLVELLNAAKNRSLKDYKVDSLSASDILPFAHSAQVERALQLYELWKKG
ncbi:unnamed protein product, partial [marine sediment metagenome]